MRYETSPVVRLSIAKPRMARRQWVTSSEAYPEATGRIFHSVFVLGNKVYSIRLAAHAGFLSAFVIMSACQGQASQHGRAIRDPLQASHRPWGVHEH